MIYLECNYTDDILLTGKVGVVDASFSHDFGIQNDTEIEVEDFKVFVSPGDDFAFYEMTESIAKGDPKRFEKYKKALIEHYENQNFDEAG